MKFTITLALTAAVRMAPVKHCVYFADLSDDTLNPWGFNYCHQPTESKCLDSAHGGERYGCRWVSTSNASSSTNENSTSSSTEDSSTSSDNSTTVNANPTSYVCVYNPANNIHLA